MIKILISLMFLVGCGDASDQNGAQKDVQETIQDETTTPDEKAKEDGTPRDVARVVSYSFNSVSELPLCDAKYEHALAYVLDEQRFFTCQAGDWFEINVAGVDGDDGLDGVDGTNGVDGRDGMDAIDVADIILVQENTFTWTDATTGLKWLRFSNQLRTETDANALCRIHADLFRMPTWQETALADTHGMFTGLTGNMIYSWVAAVGQNNMYASDWNGVGNNGGTPTGLALCIEK